MNADTKNPETPLSFFGDLSIPGLKEKYSGKVRDTYATEDGFFIAITSDRISAYDHTFTDPIPNKGLMLNLMTIHGFETIGDAVPHWFMSSPHPRVLIGHACKRIDVEVVVRGYIAGSLWKKYQTGQRTFWGYTLPDGLRENEELPRLMITPTTKEESGHDQDITREEIMRQERCTVAQWLEIEDYAKTLFKIGTVDAKTKGLILLDTKYEFGVDAKGKVRLIDEVHTPDSSRYIYAEGYMEALEKGLHQKQLSKEFLRQCLEEKGFTGKENQTPPSLEKEGMRDPISARYKELCKIMTGKKFLSFPHNTDDTKEMEAVIRKTLRYTRKPVVGIIMGSDSDLSVMKNAPDILDELCIGYELTVVSAHRTPDRLEQYAKSAYQRGLRVIIAGAGGAAHLPGMVASQTTLPVIGVPVKSSNSIDGWDSILSILQMPAGVPVATVALNGSMNAGILATQILGAGDQVITERLESYKESLITKVSAAIEKVATEYPCTFEEKL